MQRSKRRILTGLVATGVLGGALAGGGAILASAPASASSASATSAALAASTSVASTTTAAAGVDGVHFLRLRGAHLLEHGSAAYLGLTPAELRARLKAGQSLATVAAGKGKSASGLENVIVAAVTKRVDASHLSAARKTAVIGYVKDNVAAFVAAPHPFEWAKQKLAESAGSTSAATPAAT